MFFIYLYSVAEKEGGKDAWKVEECAVLAYFLLS